EAMRPKERPWLRRIGLAARLAAYGAVFFALYKSVPENIIDRPLATLTIRDIVYPLLWLGALLMLVKSLFNPTDDDAVRENWGKLGLSLIVVAIVAGALFLPNIVASFHAMSP
ncbi:MAG TPA: hypothetical protein VE175_00860, partial [Woeseiaceae bacterium]|nr:hypothetical protein [Woeseiaceae bacterium]